jgi:hypothetical protein
MVHDGGASDRGSFGWCIASSDAIFYEGSGPTAGRNPGLRFLIHYLHYRHIITPSNPEIEHFEYRYTDSKRE